MKHKIAIHNIHEVPNLFHIGIHNYILHLLKNGDVEYLYFDLSSRYVSKDFVLKLYGYLRSIGTIRGWNIPWSRISLIFSVKELNEKCDILLNFNSHLGETQFPKQLIKFNGAKIYHVNDYFWNRPGSKLNSLLVNNGVDFLFGYSKHDQYCNYFQAKFPTYLGKIIPVPFGFSERFVQKKQFSERNKKCVALGSVNPLIIEGVDKSNYEETSQFFPDEKWFHKFRRQIVCNTDFLSLYLDSMLPVFPQYKDFTYDIVAKLNEYKMFVSCESIFNFPPAKYFEGPACGSVLVCSNHACNSDLGFLNGFNCIMYDKMNIESLYEQLKYYYENEEKLEKIQEEGTRFVRENYSHRNIAISLINAIEKRISQQ